MAIVSIADPGVEVGVEGGVLVLRRQGQLLRRLVEREVEELHLTGPVELTAGARHLLLRKGIDTVFLTMDGRVRGRLLASEGAQGDRRLLQYAATQDVANRLRVAREVVAGKLVNQRLLLLQRQRTLRVEVVADALAGLRASVGQLGAAKDLDSLRGREGDAAARYFGTFPALLRNQAFTWTGRNRRPPKDPVNACLSYGYTLLVVRVAHAVRSAGLDPYLGVLHEAGRGKEALALDLAEIFRPMVDGMVLTLINRGQLGPEDFGPPDVDLLADEPELSQEGAVYLNKLGRTLLLRAWSQRLADRSPHPTTDDDWSIAGLIRTQAHALRRALLDRSPFVAAEVC